VDLLEKGKEAMAASPRAYRRRRGPAGPPAAAREKGTSASFARLPKGHDVLHGMLFFHQGDESSFVAKRRQVPKRPKRK
jgi:hypothetical protein